MALPRLSLGSEISYRSAITDSCKLKDFKDVWSRVSLIDINSMVSEYNSLEGTGNIPALTSLQGRVKAALTSIDALQKTYKDPLVIAPATDMYSALKRVECAVNSQISTYSSTRGGLFKVVNKVKKAYHKAMKPVNKVLDAYDKFSAPANALDNFANDAIKTHGANVFEGISTFGKRNKRK